MRTTVIVFFALLMSSAPAFAKNVIVLSDGSMQIEQSVKERLDIVVTKEAAQYPKAWRKAIKNPDVVVPIKSHNEYKTDGFYVETKTVVDNGVLYDTTLKEVRVVEGVVVKEWRKFNPFFILMAIAVSFMMLSNLLVWRKKVVPPYTITAMVIITTTAVVIASTATLYAVAIITIAAIVAIAVVVAAIVAVVAIADINFKGNKKYFFASSVFYILAGISTLLMYL